MTPEPASLPAPPQPTTGPKSDYVVRALISLIQEHRLSYDLFNQYCKKARQALRLTSPKTPRRLPKILTSDQLTKVLSVMESGQTSPTGVPLPAALAMRNTMILRMLFYTGARVTELVNLRIEDIDWQHSEIFLAHGKGDKDRRIVFPEAFRLTLRTYVASLGDGEEWIFPTKFRQHISVRMVQNIVRDAGKAAGVHCHPHLLRHQCFTELTRSGDMTSDQIRLISGHASAQSLARYQHLALPDVRPGYEQSIKKAGQ